MDKADLILPRALLDMLMQRVCLKVNYLYQGFNSPDVWEWESAMCRRIEHDVRSTSGVVLDTLKEYGPDVMSKTCSHDVMLTRIYMLLYFRHGDAVLYKAIVYPALMQKIGEYAGRRYEINGRTNAVRMRWDMMNDPASVSAVMLPEGMLNSGRIPSYYYPFLNHYQLYELLDAFNDESLFRALTPLMCPVIAALFEHDTDVFWVKIWNSAKYSVRHWRKSPDYSIQMLRSEQIDLHIVRRYLDHLCCYAMRVSVGDEEGARVIMDHIEENFVRKYYHAGMPSSTMVQRLKKLLEDDENFDGYDYIINPGTTVDLTLKIRGAFIEYSLPDNDEEEEPAQEVPEQPMGSDDWSASQKVRMELARLLLEKAGVTEAVLGRYGNRGKAAQVISTLLGISSGTCKVYLSDHEQSLNRKYHQEEIERLNSLLAELGSDISI